MSVEQNIAVVQSIYDAFNSHDIEKLLGTLADDFTLVDVPTGQTFYGPEGFMQWVQPFAVAAPDSTTEVTNIIASGEAVFTEHTGRGTHTGPLVTPTGAIAPTQRPFELKFAEVFQVRNGKIAAMRAYWDTGTLVRQLS
jgi:steroid delta-isomerase-like uncharacterized protein